MTAPVTTAPARARPPGTPGSSGGGDTAAPFASALDGALAAGRDDDPSGTSGARAAGNRPGAGTSRTTGPRPHDGSGGRPHGVGRRSSGTGNDGDDRPAADAADAGTDAPSPTDAVPTDPATPALPALWALAQGTGAPPAADAPPVAPGEAATAVGATSPAGGAGTGLPLPAGAPVVPDAGPTGPAVPAGPAGQATEPSLPGIPGQALLQAAAPRSGIPVPSSPAAGAPADPAAAGVAGAVVVTSATSGPPTQAADPAVPAVPADPSTGRPAIPAVPATPAGAAVHAPAAAGAQEPAATSDGPASGPASAVPAPIGTTSSSGGSASADTGDSPDQDPGPPTATPPATAAAALSAPPSVQPVAPAAAATHAPPPVATQLTQHVAVLRGGPDGTHSMTVVLTPENLGPVQVQVTLDRGTVDLQLRGAHEHGRAALMAALPELRRDLESAGLTCSRLDVDRDTGGSWTAQQQPQQSPDHGHGQTGGGETRPRPWVRPADLGEGRPVPTSTSAAPATGLDVRV